MADMKDYRASVLPFSAGNIRSIFVMPLIYESKLLGLFVMSSGKADFLDTFQMELLKVMCNQAATLHRKCQTACRDRKLVTTDGLTGLFQLTGFFRKNSQKNLKN